MKISELIGHLEKIKINSGDTEIVFSVRDYFSKYGFDAGPSFDTDGYLWTGVNTNGKQTRLSVYLLPQQWPLEEEKQPKITFRKS